VSASIFAGADDDEALLAEINVTPLVDVVLVLLFIFMITAPLLTMGLDVDLPEVDASRPVDKASVVLTIGEDGQLSVDGQLVSMEQAVERVKEKLAAQPGAVYVRGDRAVPYGFVLSACDALLSAGISEVQFVTRPLPSSADADSPQPARPRRRR
jgi:biopolymer transport protein ExbD